MPLAVPGRAEPAGRADLPSLRPICDRRGKRRPRSTHPRPRRLGFVDGGEDRSEGRRLQGVPHLPARVLLKRARVPAAGHQGEVQE